MPRDITVTFDDGTTHVYQNAPDDVTPAAVSQRAAKEFNKTVAALDGGRKGTTTGIQPELGNLEGMPRPRRVQRVPSAMAMKEVTEAAGGPEEFWSQQLNAAGRALARAPGAALDAAIAISNASPFAVPGTQNIEPFGVKMTDELLGLKQTPAQYAPTEELAATVGPQFAGAVAGGVARGGVAAANKLQSYFNPKLANYLAAAEGKGTDILNWLQNAKELVPGSKPTTAQALAAAPQGGAEFTQFASLQPRSVGNIPKEARTAYNVRRAEQEAAREEAVGRVGGTPKGKQVMEEVRSELTDPLFESARSPNNPVDVNPVTTTIDNLIAQSPRERQVVDKLTSIRDNLTGITNGQEAVSALKDIKTIMGQEKDKFTLGALDKVKDALTKAIPGMEDAQAAFAQASEPINRMNIGTVLKDALTGPLPAGTERAGAYTTALKNAFATIKKSTGTARFKTLEDAGVPKPDIDTLNNVAEDLNRSLAAEKLQAAGGGAIPKDPEKYQFEMLSRTATFINKVVATVTDYVGRKKAIQIALEMLDPKVAAEVLEQAMNMEKAQAARAAAAGRVAPVIGAAGTAAVPINALAPQNQNQNSLAGR